MKLKRRYLCVFIVCFILGIIVLKLELQRQERISRDDVRSLLLNQSIQLNDEINAAVNQVFTLRALVLGSNGNPGDLAKYGKTIFSLSGRTRNVLLAPKGIVSTVYPLKGNEAVMGLNLMGNENASASAALEAQRKNSVVLTGPYNLKQGGQAISGRLSIYLPGENGQGQYWGLASVTLDYPQVFSNGAIAFLDKNHYNYKLSKESDQGDSVLLSRGLESIDKPEKISFPIYNMRFQLEASPGSGWYTQEFMNLGLLGVIGFSLLCSLVLGNFWESRHVLQEKANKDPLTGLYNRNASFNIIEQYLGNDHYQNGAFIIMDIDNFKNVNDELGHQMGDKVLINFAQTLQRNCRASDVICRLGGDEFLMYMPFNGNGAFLKDKLNSIREQVAGKVSANEKTVQVTASIGVALADRDNTKNYKKLYAKADEALYKAKNNGKNNICYAENKKKP